MRYGYLLSDLIFVQFGASLIVSLNYRLQNVLTLILSSHFGETFFVSLAQIPSVFIRSIRDLISTLDTGIYISVERNQVDFGSLIQIPQRISLLNLQFHIIRQMTTYWCFHQPYILWAH